MTTENDHERLVDLTIETNKQYSDLSNKIDILSTKFDSFLENEARRSEFTKGLMKEVEGTKSKINRVYWVGGTIAAMLGLAANAAELLKFIKG